MYYDFHIHSCLSPCGQDEMTPYNIVNMAKLKGLQWIAVTDHNSCAQLPAMANSAKQVGLGLIYGVELQSLEEVHCLAYFLSLSQAMEFYQWLIPHQSKLPNNPTYFGHQYIMDETDQILGEEGKMLLDCLDCSLTQLENAVHQFQGKFVLAHIVGKANGIVVQLGFIPQDLAFDALEIRKEEDKELVLHSHAWLKDPLWLISSDAHQLIDIAEAQHDLTEQQWQRLWGETR